MIRLLELNPNLRPNVRYLLDSDWFTDKFTPDKQHPSKVRTETAVLLTCTTTKSMKPFAHKN